MQAGPHPTPHEELIALVREQEALYERLVALSEAQRGAIEAGRSDELLGVLGQRQQLVDAIVEVSTRLEPFRERFEELVSGLPEAYRSEVNERVERLGSLMRSIAERDEADRALLKKHRDELSGSVEGVRRSAGAVKAYGASGRGASPMFRDSKA